MISFSFIRFLDFLVSVYQIQDLNNNLLYFVRIVIVAIIVLQKTKTPENLTEDEKWRTITKTKQKTQFSNKTSKFFLIISKTLRLFSFISF